MSHHHPTLWHGRTDTEEGPLAHRWHQEVQLYPDPPLKTLTPGIVLQGFVCDEGVRRNQGRPGAAGGPAALRHALAHLAWHGGLPLYDAGDVVCEGEKLEDAQKELGQHVAQALNHGHFSLVLGGGNEASYGHWLGLTKAHPTKHIGIINLDAHFDLRQNIQATSGTPFAQIAAHEQARRQPFSYLCLGISEPSNTAALFETAKNLGVEWRLDRDMMWEHHEVILRQIFSFTEKVDAIYLTIDLDVLPAHQMPAVSAPAAYGVELRVIELIATSLAQSGKLMAADVVELNPKHDVDGRGAKVGARVVWGLVKHL
jgi:formiminoglutamase